MPIALLALLAACAGGDAVPVSPEPLDLPDDPAARGVPVGVRTAVTEGVKLEVWYPAADAAADDEAEAVSFQEFLPTAFTDRVGEVVLPTLDTVGAVRDAPVRPPEAPYPVVLFSHGFGGFRVQSASWAAHLASRGYVVVAPDHPGRMLGDVLPCLFSPPLDGCDLSGFIEDPAVEDLAIAMDWVERAATSGPLAGALDLDHIGLSGHSAGGATTSTVGQDDERFSALLLMAAGADVTRDVPVAMMGGTCDGVVPISAGEESLDGLVDGALVTVEGAGHLAFSDLCTLDLASLATDLLDGRDDLNTFLYEQMFFLATDGCPGTVPAVESEVCADGFLDLGVSDEIIRDMTVRFFDQALRGEGGGVADGEFPEATVTTGAGG